MSAIPNIAMRPVTSSQIAAIGHAPELNLLAIQFTGKGDKPGSLYHYENVTGEIFSAFAGAESIGSHFYKHIKPFADKFPYTKVDPAALAPAVPALSKELLAIALSRRQYRNEITEDEEQQAKAAGLVVIFGGSDDLMVLRGAVHDEYGCYGGGTALIDAAGLLPAREGIEDDDALKDYFERQPAAKTVEALWAADDASWSYRADVPHATFEIMDGDELYCRGIVISLADLGGAA